jgi:hypothetical protein
MSIKLKSVLEAEVQRSSAYTGGPDVDGYVIVARGLDGKPTQMVFRDSLPENSTVIANQSTPGGGANGNSDPLKEVADMYTAVHPRYGQNVAAAEYLPPIVSMIPIGGQVPRKTTFTEAGVLTRAYADASDVDGKKRSISTSQKIWPLTSQTLLDIPAFHTIATGFTVPDSITKLTEGSFTTSGWYSSSSVRTILLKNGTDQAGGVIFIDGDIALDVIPADTDYILIVTGKIFAAPTNTKFNVQTGPGSVAIIALGGFYIDEKRVDPTQDFRVAKPTAFYILRPSDDNTGFLYSTSDADVTNTVVAEISETAGFAANMSMLHQAYVTIDGVRVGIVPTYFNFSKSVAEDLPLDADMYEFLRLQFMAQYRVDVTDVIPVVKLEGGSRGSYCVQFTIDGTIYESFVAVQQDLVSLPNAGVATEPYRLIDGMLQAYRVSEDGYAFWGKGDYITVNSAGSFTFNSMLDTASDGSFNSDLVVPYNLNDTKDTRIDAVRTTGVSTEREADTDVAVEGGVDPFVAVSDGFDSAYTHFEFKTGNPTRVVYIAAPYDSHVEYCPLGGYIKSAQLATSTARASCHLNYNYLLVRNLDPRSKSVRITCTVSPTLTGDFHSGENVMSNYGRPLDGPFVSYYNKNFADLLCRMTTKTGLTIDRIIRLQANESRDIYGDGNIYTYSPPTTQSLGMITKNDRTLSSLTYAAVQPKDEVIDVIVVFGDMVQEARASKFTLSEENFEYYSRDYEGIVAHQKKSTFWFNGSSFNNDVIDATYRTEAEINALLTAGLQLRYLPYNTITATRVRPENPGFVMENLKLMGCKLARYAPDAFTASIDLFPGSYTANKWVPAGDDTYMYPETTIVVNEDRTINVVYLPFILGNDVYVGYVTQSAAGDSGISVEKLTGTHDVIESKLNSLDKSAYTLNTETTLDWDIKLRSDSSYSEFRVTGGKKDDKITVMAGLKKYILTLEQDVPEDL